MSQHQKIDYVELPSNDFDATRTFYGLVFDFKFDEYGAEYLAFTDQGVDGGFTRSERSATVDNGSVLVVFYSEDLEETENKISEAGGIVSTPTHSFPGGRRFHFLDPCGNELAVWSDLNPDGSACG